MCYFISGFLLKGFLYHFPSIYHYSLMLSIFLFFIYINFSSNTWLELIKQGLFYSSGILYFCLFIHYPVDFFNPHFLFNPQEHSIAPDFIFSLPTQTPQDIKVWLKAFLFNQATKEETQIYKDIFKASGLLHVLVISGSHITIFYLLLTLLYQLTVNFLNLIYPKFPKLIRLLQKIGPWFCLTWIWIYCNLVGFSPPIQRAFLMAFVMCCVRSLEKKAFGNFLLLNSFGLQILAFPKSIFSISTILSWTSLLISSQIEFRNFQFRNIIYMFYLQFLIGVVVMILCGNFSVVGVFTNILFLPMNSLVLFASIFAAFAYLTPSFLNIISYEVIRFYIYLVSCFAEIESWNFQRYTLFSDEIFSLLKLLLLGLIFKTVLDSFSIKKDSAENLEPRIYYGSRNSN